ncbi:MAG: hypothetical protein QXK37_00815 [Candidatus Woesearchaeota archaeon]
MANNLKERIQLLLNRNPNLTHERIAVLLTISSLYSEPPADISAFREIYPHFDPNIIDSNGERITFLRICNSNEPISVIKHRLNSYLNIKFRDLEHEATYEENMVLFKKYSEIASTVLADILKMGAYPNEIVDLLKEQQEVKKCIDFYQMLTLYNKTLDRRTRFEILRKLGLIIMLARINRSISIDELDVVMKKLWRVFNKGLGFKRLKHKEFYLWLDASNHLVFSEKKIEAIAKYKKDAEARRLAALPVFQMQTFEFHPFITHNRTEVLHLNIRNKLRKDGKPYYSSFIEKLVRKNLEFPNQIHDVLGVLIVVKEEEHIKNLVSDLEMFLGGSSARKKEKNSYHKFGKKPLGEYSSNKYAVWKAVYDIPLSNPLLDLADGMIKMLGDNKLAQNELKRKVKFLTEKPKDFVVELQLQDLNSYLLGIVKGSSAEHSLLKSKQVRMNSFYKFYPQEIYAPCISELQLKLLNG